MARDERLQFRNQLAWYAQDGEPLDTKTLWVVRRLVRRGYRICNGGDGWLALFKGETYDPCNINIVVKRGVNLAEATFRPRFESHIHVKAYLVLSQRDWSELDRFETLTDLYQYRLGTNQIP